MKVTKVLAYLVRLRYFEPFKIALGENVDTTNVVVKVECDEGLVGYGEASPSKNIMGETPDMVLEALEKIVPSIINLDVFSLEGLHERMGVVEGIYSAKAALDIAFHDLLGKACGKPVCQLLGGYRREIETDFTLSIKPPAKSAEDAVKAVGRGFRVLKVKMGLDPDEDVERVRMVREAVGDRVRLRVDANQGWTVDAAVRTINKLEGFGVDFVEQPVAAGDLRGLVEVKRRVSIPIMVDETVRIPEDALLVAKVGAADLINIKLMKSAGIHGAVKIAAIAEAAGLKCMVGCMAESKIGISAGVHFSLGVRNVVTTDLDCDLLLKDDTVKMGGCMYEKGVRKAPELPGLGIQSLNEELLGKPQFVWPKNKA